MQLTNAIILSTAIVSLLWNNHCFSQEADISAKRCLNMASEYKNTRFTGTFKKIYNKEVTEERRFQLNIFDGKVGEYPWEILYLVENPGEPHLESKQIVDQMYAFDGELGFYFKREYVSKPPQSAKMSGVSISSSPPQPPGLLKSILAGADSACPLDYDDLKGREDEFVKVEMLGHETYLGIEAVRARYSLVKLLDRNNKVSPPLTFEVLLGTNPSLQLLKVLSVSGGAEGYLTPENLYQYLEARKVDSVRKIDKWLICDQVRFVNSEGDGIYVVIEDIETLPTNYKGAFDYYTITGAAYGGDAEKATRKGRNRKMWSHTKELSYVPFTEEEEAKIHSYLLDKTTPIEPKLNWVRIGFWCLNAVASIAIFYIGLQYIRRQRAS